MKFLMRLPLIGIAATAALTFTSCKPPAGASSEAKTIDSFAANTKIRTNECRGAEDVADANGRFNLAKYESLVSLKNRIVVEVGDAALKEQLMNETLVALSAVPEFSQTLFAKMDGFIRVTPQASALCGRFLGDEKNPNYVDESFRDTIESCSMLTDFPDGKGGNKRSLTLVIDAKSGAAGHNLVRGFGFLHAQFYPRMRRNLGGSGSVYVLDGADTPAMKALKTQLARNFLTDMLASESKNGVFRVEGLTHLLGKSTDQRSITEVMKANVAESQDLFAGLSLTYPGETKTLSASERDVRAQAVMDHIAAEGYDSLYCRPQGSFSASAAAAANKPEDLKNLTNTTRVFETFFEQTYGNYTNGYVPALQAQAHEIIATISGHATGEATDTVVQPGAHSGFGLAGTNDWMAMLAALMVPMQRMPYVNNFGSFSPTQAAQMGSAAAQYYQGAQGAGNLASAGTGCPCGCNGPNCNCAAMGCTGSNCSCSGCSGGGYVSM